MVSQLHDQAVMGPCVSPKRTGRKILVVDDELGVRKFIEGSLRAGGYNEVFSCGSGGTVPSLALRENPHLIIMDIMMPGGNGMRAYRQLKNTARTAGIPVVMVSGFNVLPHDPGSNQQPPLFLAKPFTTGRLLEAVQQALGELTGPAATG